MIKPIRIIACTVIVVSTMILHISADGLENFSFQLSPAIEMPVGHRSFLWDAGAEYSMGGSVSLRG